MRLGAIFVAICMVIIAASAGATAYLYFGASRAETATVALAVLAALVLYIAFAIRNDRGAQGARSGQQIADLARGQADLRRQVAEVTRRLAAAESRLDAIPRATATPPSVRAAGALAQPPAADPPAETATPTESAAEAESKPAPQAPAAAGPAAHEEALLTLVREVIDANRIDLYLQPIVTLPQRKVRYYEAMSRLRDERGELLHAASFIPQAESAGLMPKVDNLVIFRCVQVVRRLLLKNRDIGLFCNLSATTLTDSTCFPRFLDFMDANRAIASARVHAERDARDGAGRA